MQSNAQVWSEVAQCRVHAGGMYQKARDARKRPIRGRWKHNERFYAQLTFERIRNWD